jgi:hypothetical protein
MRRISAVIRRYFSDVDSKDVEIFKYDSQDKDWVFYGYNTCQTYNLIMPEIELDGNHIKGQGYQFHYIREFTPLNEKELARIHPDFIRERKTRFLKRTKKGVEGLYLLKTHVFIDETFENLKEKIFEYP